MTVRRPTKANIALLSGPANEMRWKLRLNIGQTTAKGRYIVRPWKHRQFILRRCIICDSWFWCQLLRTVSLILSNFACKTDISRMSLDRSAKARPLKLVADFLSVPFVSWLLSPAANYLRHLRCIYMHPPNQQTVQILLHGVETQNVMTTSTMC